jgi:hypothetical protein
MSRENWDVKCSKHDPEVRRQGNYITLINIKKARLRHWNGAVKTEKPDQLGHPPHLLLDVTVTRTRRYKGAVYIYLPF